MNKMHHPYSVVEHEGFDGKKEYQLIIEVGKSAPYIDWDLPISITIGVNINQWDRHIDGQGRIFCTPISEPIGFISGKEWENDFYLFGSALSSDAELQFDFVPIKNAEGPRNNSGLLRFKGEGALAFKSRKPLSMLHTFNFENETVFRVSCEDFIACSGSFEVTVEPPKDIYKGKAVFCLKGKGKVLCSA